MRYEIKQGFNSWWQLSHKGQPPPFREGDKVVTDPSLLSSRTDCVAVCNEINANLGFAQIPLKYLVALDMVFVIETSTGRSFVVDPKYLLPYEGTVV